MIKITELYDSKRESEDATIQQITEESPSEVQDNVNRFMDGSKSSNPFGNLIAGSSTSPTTLTQMSNQLKHIGSVIDNQQAAYNAMNTQMTTVNAVPNLEIRASSQKYPYHNYYDHIHGFSQLFDPTIARQYAHTFFVETLFMLCDNATDEVTYKELILYINLIPNMFTGCSSSPPPLPTQEAKQVPQTVEEKYTNFVIGLTAEVEGQHSVNMTMLTIEFNMREEYLKSQKTLIDSVVNQQEVLIESLIEWSHYLDKQAQEYAYLYEELSTKMTTYKRKDVFDVQESNSLDVWTNWSTILFWVLVVVLMLMFVVQHYRSLSSMAEQAEQHLKDTASKAYDAITHAKSK